MKKTFKEYNANFYKNYWPDPVWSKVISFGIITILGSTMTSIYVLIKSIVDQVSISTVTSQVFNYFGQSIAVNTFIFWVSLLIIGFTLYLFLKKFITEIILKIKFSNPTTLSNTGSNELPIISETSTAFFSYRLAKAFPGQRGLKWYEPKISVERFKILFQDPLIFKSGGHECVSDPIWWFRGNSNSFIDSFKVLSKSKILLGIKELEIKKVAVYISDAYYKCFIYVESKGEKQTGLYKLSDEVIKRNVESSGYCAEEFGLLGKRTIRREHFDDGATIVNNKVIDASKAELRKRYLSDYNFLISAKQAPYNSDKFDQETKDLFNDLLIGKIKLESVIDYFESYHRNEN